MRNILLLLIPVLILCIYGGCGNNDKNCEFLEYEENLDNSECIAEDFLNMDLLRGCSIGIGCNGVDTSIFNFETCTVIDCETIECENIFFEGELSPGFMSNLELGITSVLIGDFLINEMEIPFECLFFQP